MALIERLAETGDPATRAKLVPTLCRLGVVFDSERHEYADFEQAEACYRRAIEIGEQLHQTRAHPDIAVALLGLGSVLSGIANYSWLRSSQARAEALDVTREAVEIGRKLRSERGDEVESLLVDGLGQLAMRLREVGQREQAAVVSAEAVELGRRLASRDPDRFALEFARRLLHHANHLLEIGRVEEAVIFTREAAARYENLAGEHPDVAPTERAMCLTNLTNNLNHLGRWEEALSVAREAVEVARNSSSDPRLLGHALFNLGRTLKGMGRRDEALDATRQAVEFFRDCEARAPHTVTPYLAYSLTGLGDLLIDGEQYEQAVEVVSEGLSLWRLLAGRDRELHLPELAASLLTLGRALCHFTPSDPDALEIQREAVETHRELERMAPGANAAALGVSLNNYAYGLGNVGRFEEALRAAEESVAILRSCWASLPKVSSPQLAMALLTLGGLLEDLREPARACDAIAEGLQVILPLLLDKPPAHHSQAVRLAEALRRICDRHDLPIPEHLAPTVNHLLDPDPREPLAAVALAQPTQPLAPADDDPPVAYLRRLLVLAVAFALVLLLAKMCV